MSEQIEIPTILRRGVEVDLSGLVFEVVPFVARDYIETLDAVVQVYAQLAAGGALADVPFIEVAARHLARVPDLQARALRFRSEKGPQRVSEQWVLDNLDAYDMTVVVDAICQVNRVEDALKNWQKARARVAAALAGLKPSFASPSSSDAPPTTH